MREEEKIISLPEAGWEEAAASSFKRALALLPSLPVLSLFDELLSSRISALAEKRIRETFETVQSTIDVLPKKILESEEFTDATVILLRNTAQEHNIYKHKKLCALYKEFLERKTMEPESILVDEFEMWSRVVRELSVPSFELLLQIRQLDHDFPIHTGEEKSAEYEKRTALLAADDLFPRHERELETQGLTTTAGGFYEVGSSPRMTKAGLAFLRWIAEGTTRTDTATE